MSLVIIGAGPGGYVAAIKAAQLGEMVSLVEDSEVGGTCLNRGCIPTKTLLASTELLAKTRELDKFGIELEGSVRPNLSKMMARKDKVVDIQVKGIRALLKSWNINLIEGRGCISGDRKIEIDRKDGGSETLEADNIIIATGSRPAEIPAFPFDGSRILSSDHALGLTDIPGSMTIVGAGVIGCEWAFIFRELGTEITMVELLDRAVATEDTEVSSLLARELKKKKIKLLTGTGIVKAKADDSGVTSYLSDGNEIVSERMLVSIGRAFNSSGLGLEGAGVETGKAGEILVNERMQTNIEGIYAIGDVTGGMLLAHTAFSEGMVAAMNACGHEASMDYSCVPAAIFTTPEIASVGIRDFQAEEQGLKVRTGRFQYRALGKAHAMGEIAGFIKVMADEKTDRLLGVHIIGPHASDIIHEAALAIRNNLTAGDIAKTIHAHPTLAEGLFEAAEDVHGNAIHKPKG
jgi:dihydrolipoamide dehydrogenase